MRYQLVLAAALFTLGTFTSTSAPAAEVTVALAVRDGGFEPAEIRVPPGGRIRIEVTNQTPVAIEFESFDLNRERVVQPGQTAAVYVSGLATGRYDFFDDFHQERRGTLVAE